MHGGAKFRENQEPAHSKAGYIDSIPSNDHYDQYVHLREVE